MDIDITVGTYGLYLYVQELVLVLYSSRINSNVMLSNFPAWIQRLRCFARTDSISSHLANTGTTKMMIHSFIHSMIDSNSYRTRSIIFYTVQYEIYARLRTRTRTRT